jgi:hypothetical protein
MPHPLRRAQERVDADGMAAPDPANKYAVSLDDLEASTHVPLEDQTPEQPSAPADVSDAEQLEERRQFRLAGGA